MSRVKFSYKWVAAFLSMALLFTMLPFGGAKAEASSTTWDGTTVDTSWYQDGLDSYTISTPAQLAGLAQLVNNEDDQKSFEGATVTLTADIDLGSHEWTPIGISYNSAFCGTFCGDKADGSTCTISNLKIAENDSSYQGLFGYIYDATFKNLTVSGAITTEEGAFVAGIVGHAGTKTGAETNGNTIENCHSSVTVNAKQYVAGIVGKADEITIKNCSNTGNITASGNYVGGIVGDAYYNINITNCYNTGNIKSTDEYGGLSGGIAGRLNGYSYSLTISKITNCYNAGQIEGSNYVGGFIGRDNTDENTITSCYNAGDVIGHGQPTPDSMPGMPIMFMCGENIGGFIGNVFSGVSLTIDDCYQAGTVYVITNPDSTTVKALIGEKYSSATVTVTNCYYNSNKSDYSLASDTLGTGLTTVKMTGEDALTNMSGLNAENWTANANTTSDTADSYYYPTLKALTQTPAPCDSVGVEFVTNLETKQIDYTVGDTATEIKIELDKYITMQWQSSTDNKTWTDIENQKKFSKSCGYTPSTAENGTTYYRVALYATNNLGAVLTKTVYSDVATVVVSKPADPNYLVPPESNTEAIYGTTLADITVPSSDFGTFAFEDELTTSVGDFGTNTFTLIYTPNDDKYRTEKWDMKIIVIEKKEQVVETAGNTTAVVDEKSKEILQNLFTKEEIAQNIDMNVALKVDVIKGEIVKDEQKLFDDLIADYNKNLAAQKMSAKQAMVLDVSVIKTLGTQTSLITNLDSPINITIDIPNEYLANGRNFFIVRNHNGALTILKDLDNNPSTMTFATDCFSKYTLNYTEADMTSSPDTGDQNSTALPFMMLIASIISLSVLIKKQKLSFLINK